MKRAVTALALVLVALPAWPQSSGATDASMAEKAEKAKKERAARRAAGGTAAKSFGNDDLKGGGSAGASSPASTPESSAKADAKSDKAEKTDAQAAAQKREALEKQVAEERKRIALIEKTMADAQRELGDITNFSYGTRRAALQKFLEDGTVELAKARQKVGDLEEEARRLGASASR